MKAYKAFGLKENCFAPSPNPRFLYLTDQTNACLFKCKFVIEEKQGLSLIVGKIGYGKTSVLRELINGYIDDEHYKIAMLPNGSFPRRRLGKRSPGVHSSGRRARAGREAPALRRESSRGPCAG